MAITETLDSARVSIASSVSSRTYYFNGTYDELAQAQATTFNEGETFRGGVITSTLLRRERANHGILEVTTSESHTPTTPPSESNTPLKIIWECKFSQQEFDILTMCGTSASEARANQIALWRDEPDPDLYENYQYRPAEGEDPITLSEASQKIAKKIQAGITSYIRFYPVISKTGIYKATPTALGANLATIGAPETTFGLSYQWLKIADDLSQNSDGTYKRVESWQGATKWDTDLYGAAAPNPI